MSQSRRPDRRNGGPPQGVDRLPPHSIEAEQGVLGCVLLDPSCLAQIRERFAPVGAPTFYDLRHQEIFTSLCGMQDEGKMIDVLTLSERLKNVQKLEQIGGISYLAGLPDVVPSAAHVRAYVEIVREKHVLRQIIAECARATSVAYDWQGSVDTLALASAQRMADINAQLARSAGAVAPMHIKTLDQFADEVYDAFFGLAADPEAAGRELPFHFPFRVRNGEMTFMLGEKGMGKSTLWSWIMVWLMHQGAKCFVASMEVKKRDTIKKAICQLLGRNKLADTPEEHAVFHRATAWFKPRVALFDFLGIVPWRDLLEAMKRARQELECDTFVVDSVMRIGVHAEDIAEQDECAKHFGDFATSNDCHVFMINHLNKSDGDAKKRSRGSFAWVDNSHNVVSVLRNQEKSKKIGEIFANQKAGMTGYTTMEAVQAKLDELKPEWDGRFYLHNQRMDGTQQNGSCHLWFDFHSGQYRDDYDALPGMNLLDRWAPEKRKISREGAKEAKE